MADETVVYIGLGSNLGQKEANIKKALKALSAETSIKLIASSSIIETKPLAEKKQPNYLNCVAKITTSLEAGELLKVLKRIESEGDRKESAEKWSSRTIDLDILLFGDEIIQIDQLTVPHRQMHLRSFVLSGLCELAPQVVHPVLQENASVLYKRLNGKDFYIDTDKGKLISIAGVIGAGKSTLATGLSNKFGFELIKESYETNPFMQRVYAGDKTVALDSQLYFLLSRCEQLKEENLTPGYFAVSDYIMDKEMIYAELWLDPVQRQMYEKINAALNKTVASPSLAVYLKLAPDKCLERVKKRKRPYEQKLELPFLEELSAGYEKLFEKFDICPAMTIDADEFDFRRDGEIEKLGAKINYYIGCD
ncbi:MAG: 2-amino-4-hydroxy-6-hydroxymethyldihydropteridine diphosphokinase [Sedimentisphaerales bacterium]|nr:2-amino-4-hydroxy-6-hydroxymethyldihydropteridine diphosphokinase [Sedimentisphaerales bacterium]